MAERKITEVSSVSSLGASDSIFVNSGSTLKQITKTNLMGQMSSPLDSWPVGSVYISYNSTSPASFWGGS